MVCGDLALQLLDLVAFELDDLATVHVDHVVVVAATVQLVNGLAALEIVLEHEAGGLELGQHPVHRGQADLVAMLQQLAVDVFGGHVVLGIALLEQRNAQHHMTAEDIYRQLLEHGDEIGLATVYRVLTQFEAAGLVLKHNFEGGQAVYELDRGGHHDHMVDVDSGKIIEFESHEIEELQRKIAADHGYELEEHSLVLYVRKKRK